MSDSKKKPLISELITYLRSPRSDVEHREVWYIKIFNTLRLWSLGFVIGIVAVLIGNYFLEQTGYDHDEFAITQLFEEVSVVTFLLMILVWAPISEEIAFRFGLRFSPFRLGTQITGLIFFSLLHFEVDLIPQFIFEDIGSWGEILVLGSFFVFGVILISIFLNIHLVKKRVERVFRKYFAFIFYILAIIFAILHMGNYQDNWLELWYLAPLLVMPQFLLALIASFLRMYYGFIWAVIVHGLNNGIIGVLLVFLMPFIELEEIAYKVDEAELVQHLSVADFLSIITGCFFFMGIALLVLICITSLVYEYLVSNKRDRVK